MFISGPLEKICRVTLKVMLREKIRNGDFYRNTASRLQFVLFFFFLQKTVVVNRPM